MFLLSDIKDAVREQKKKRLTYITAEEQKERNKLDEVAREVCMVQVKVLLFGLCERQRQRERKKERERERERENERERWGADKDGKRKREDKER